MDGSGRGNNVNGGLEAPMDATAAKQSSFTLHHNPFALIPFKITRG